MVPAHENNITLFNCKNLYEVENFPKSVTLYLFYHYIISQEFLQENMSKKIH